MFLRLYFVNNGKKNVKMRVNLNVPLCATQTHSYQTRQKF